MGNTIAVPFSDAGFTNALEKARDYLEMIGLALHFPDHHTEPILQGLRQNSESGILERPE